MKYEMEKRKLTGKALARVLNGIEKELVNLIDGIITATGRWRDWSIVGVLVRVGIFVGGDSQVQSIHRFVQIC